MAGFAAIALDNVYMSSLGMFLDAFELVRIQVMNIFSTRARVAMQSPLRLLTADGRPASVAGGRQLAADDTLDSQAQYALVHIPGFVAGSEAALAARLANSTRLCEWLRQQHQGGSLISASGSAVFVLAEAGLLDAEIAAVARPLVPLFRRRYPGIRIDHRRSFVEHERVFTSIGWAADPQLLARLVERTTTPELARWIADVTGLHRVTEGRLVEDELVANAQLWLENRFAGEARIADLAHDLAVSEQTLLRHFRRHLSMTPRDYVRKLRMEAARSMLLQTTRSVQQVAALVGYDDVHAFAKVFRQLTGCSANQFRARAKKTAPRSGFKN